MADINQLFQFVLHVLHKLFNLGLVIALQTATQLTTTANRVGILTARVVNVAQHLLGRMAQAS